MSEIKKHAPIGNSQIRGAHQNVLVCQHGAVGVLRIDESNENCCHLVDDRRRVEVAGDNRGRGCLGGKGSLHKEDHMRDFRPDSGDTVEIILPQARKHDMAEADGDVLVGGKVVVAWIHELVNGIHRGNSVLDRQLGL